MRKMLTLLLLALMVPTVAANHEELHLDGSYVARIAEGDVPGTNATEPAGFVHILEYVRFAHANQTEVFVGTPESLSCTCSFSPGDGVINVGAENPAGDYIVTVRNTVEPGRAYGVPLTLLAGHESDAVIKVYLREGISAYGPVDAKVVGGVFDARPIHTFQGTGNNPLPTNFWLSVTPTVTVVEAPEEGFGIMELALGIVIGVLVWFFLVQKGFVQARSRKQVVAKAVHEEVAAAESKDMLATRKRVLMAGLKELEMAKMQKEVDDLTYDSLKAELKKEAVTAMRALESHE